MEATDRSGGPAILNGLQFRSSLMAPATRLKRKRKHDLRQMMNIILWLLPTGCQWRNLPVHWPNWQAVYYYFGQWKQDGPFERINLALNKLDRKRVDKEVYPSVLCIDTQSVKLSPMISEHQGTDANKRVNGLKRPLVVDTQGRLWVAACSCGSSSRRTRSYLSNWRYSLASKRTLRKSVWRSILQWRFCQGFSGLGHPF